MLVDTNVLIDVLENDPDWADWSIEQLRAQSKLRPLAINAIIYAELSLVFSRVEDLDSAIDGLGLALLEIPRPALFLASRAFMQYKRAVGVKSNVLPDFLIGAHAATEHMPVLTRDVRRYKTYFPTVTLVAPSATP